MHTLGVMPKNQKGPLSLNKGMAPNMGMGSMMVELETGGPGVT